VVVRVYAAVPAPVASFTAQHVACTGGTFLSTSQNADTLSWTFNEMAPGTFDTIITGQTLIVIPGASPSFAEGVFTVCLTAKNTTGTSQVCDTFNFLCGGINEIATSDYKLYPNPASSSIQIDLSGVDLSNMKDVAGIEIYDMLGEKLVSSPISQTSVSISVNLLASGLYIISLTDKADNRKVLGKFEVLR
jgi:hypothetical protein